MFSTIHLKVELLRPTDDEGNIQNGSDINGCQETDFSLRNC